MRPYFRSSKANTSSAEQRDSEDMQRFINKSLKSVDSSAVHREDVKGTYYRINKSCPGLRITRISNFLSSACHWKLEIITAFYPTNVCTLHVAYYILVKSLRSSSPVCGWENRQTCADTDGKLVPSHSLQSGVMEQETSKNIQGRRSWGPELGNRILSPIEFDWIRDCTYKRDQ